MNARRLTIFSVPIISLSVVGLAWWLTPEVVEQRFAPDGTINDSTRAQIALFRVGLCVLAVLLAVAPSLLWISARLRRLVWRWEIPVPPLLAQAYCAAGALMPSEIMRFSTTGLSDSMMLPSEKREFSIAIAFALWLLVERNRHHLYSGINLLAQVAEQQQEAEHFDTIAQVPRQAAG
jgi:hypothetical protein